MVGLWIGVLFAAALPLLLLVSLHVCLAGLCLPSCGSGSALGCRCSAAAPACLPSCLPCWPLSPFLWVWIGAWLPLLFRCSCLSSFMFALLAFVSFHVALDRRLAAATLSLLKIPGLNHICCSWFVVLGTPEPNLKGFFAPKLGEKYRTNFFGSVHLLSIVTKVRTYQPIRLTRAILPNQCSEMQWTRNMAHEEKNRQRCDQ